MLETVRLNYANCIEEVIGDNGISLNDIKALNERFEEAYGSIEKQKNSNKMGFMNLPFNEDLAKQVKHAAKEYACK